MKDNTRKAYQGICAFILQFDLTPEDPFEKLYYIKMGKFLKDNDNDIENELLIEHKDNLKKIISFLSSHLKDSF